MKKITGSLQEKNGKYYAVINHYEADGKRKLKWYDLDLEVKKGNKRLAEERKNELLVKLNAGTDFLLESLTPAERERNRIANMAVEDYLPEWLEGHKRNISNSTYENYRHSCASLLLTKHIPMKMIQDWLGHSDIQTTANIYSHLDIDSKQESAAAIGEALGM